MKETKKKLKQEEMKDYQEEIPENVWEYVESWFQFNNNQKQTVMKTREEIFNELMKKSKANIADICAGLIHGCTFDIDEEGEDSYNRGWLESKKSIFEI